MSLQIIELLIFAVIAFLVINKLISILGSTTENDSTIQNSVYGEPSEIKNNVNETADWTVATIPNMQQLPLEVNDLLADPNDEVLRSKLIMITSKVNKFNPVNFVKNVGKAWQMILEILLNREENMLKDLVDKRFIEQLKNHNTHYQLVNLEQLPEVKILEITFFGNSIIVKLAIKADELGLEEWSFSRNINQTGPNWLLSNIDNSISVQ